METFFIFFSAFFINHGRLPRHAFRLTITCLETGRRHRDLLDLNPLFSNCVERRSSFRPGDRDFNHEWTSDGPNTEESEDPMDFAIFFNTRVFPTMGAINSLRARDLEISCQS